MCAPCACLVFEEVRKSLRAPGAAATDACALLDRCWEPRLGLLEEEAVALNHGAVSAAIHVWLFCSFSDRAVSPEPRAH